MMQNFHIKIFSDHDQLASGAASLLAGELLARPEKGFHTLALSGGSTPAEMFRRLAAVHGADPCWSRTEIFWGDERCVSPLDPESNFHMATENLLNRLTEQPVAVHRIRGELEPHLAAEEYESVLCSACRTEHGRPVLDTVILGIGTDGHTASLFPGVEPQQAPAGITCVSRHPQTGQLRVSLTARTIQSAVKVIFLVSGAAKSSKIIPILTGAGATCPAAVIAGNAQCVEWWLDLDAVGDGVAELRTKAEFL